MAVHGDDIVAKRRRNQDTWHIAKKTKQAIYDCKLRTSVHGLRGGPRQLQRGEVILIWKAKLVRAGPGSSVRGCEDRRGSGDDWYG